MTSLEQYQAQLENAPEGSKAQVFEKLLDEYPLLFGYWIQYAELADAQKPGSAETVYKRAVAAIPSSVTLWVSYLSYLIEKTQSSREHILETFGIAEKLAGRDYYSDALWDKHIEYANSIDPSGSTTAGVLKRVTSLPLYQYSKYFEEMSKLSQTIPELATEVGKFSQVQKLVNERWAFESKITQNYFHVVPLDQAQIDAWSSYLDFEENSGYDRDQTLSLYERCLVPAALVPSFWKRWFHWADDSKKPFILRRGILFTNDFNLKLLLAVYEESAGAADSAAELLDSALVNNNDKEQVFQLYTYRYNLERRRNNGDNYLKQIDNEYSFGLAAQHSTDPEPILDQGLKKYPHSAYLYEVKIKLGLISWKELLESPLPPHLIMQLGGELVDETAGTPEWLTAYYEFEGPFSVQKILKQKLARDGKASTTDKRLKAENGHPGVALDKTSGEPERSQLDRYQAEQQKELKG